jgi:hypothetical protein
MMRVATSNRAGGIRAWASVRSQFVPHLLAVLTTAVTVASRPLPASAQDTRSFVWDRVDVAVTLQGDSTLHITEQDRAIFTGGPYHSGFRDIPLDHVTRISGIRVASVKGTGLQPFSFVWPGSFSIDVPDTFTARNMGSMVRIEWSFSATTSEARTFQLDYDAHGALRVYADHDPPYQQLSWIGVDRALTQDAPVNTATLTFILPRPLDPDQTRVVGPAGGPSGEHFTNGQTWTWTAKNLHAGDSLEATLQFPPLVAATKASWQDASDRHDELTLFFPILALVIGVSRGSAVRPCSR